MNVKNVDFRSQIDRLPSAGPPCASTIFAYATLTQEFGFQLWEKNLGFQLSTKCLRHAYALLQICLHTTANMHRCSNTNSNGLQDTAID